MRTLIFSLLLSTLSFPAFAGGSLLFSREVLPLLEGQPDFLEALRPLDIEEAGEGRRLSPRVAPALAGNRIPPYRFRAQGKNGRYLVTVNCDLEFFNAEGKVVFRIVDGLESGNMDALAEAISYTEKASSLTIKAESDLRTM